MTQYHEEDSERKLKRWTETTIVWVPYFKWRKNPFDDTYSGIQIEAVAIGKEIYQ